MENDTPLCVPFEKESSKAKKRTHIHGDEIKTTNNVLFSTCQMGNYVKVLTISSTGEKVERAVLSYIA